MLCCLSDFVKVGNFSKVYDKGNSSQSPEAQQVHKYAEKLIKLMAELGLTPSSRSRLRVEGKQEEDPFAEFLKRRMEAKAN